MQKEQKKNLKNINFKGLIFYFRKNFQKFWSISRISILIVVVAVASAASIIGSLSLRELYQNKIKDTWAILFLNLEHVGASIQLNLRECCVPSTDTRKAVNYLAHYRIGSNRKMPINRIDGRAPERVHWYEFGLKQPPSSGTWNAVSWGGKIVTLLISEKDVHIWEANVSNWISIEKGKIPSTKIYAITRSGLLVYSNTIEINQSSYLDRQLVASFVKKRITNGQIELYENGEIFGFFYEVPRTNIIIFGETSKSKALAIISNIIGKYSIFFVAILALSSLLVGWITAKLLAPIRELSILAHAIGQGDFSKKPQLKGAGELGPLVDSFGIMIANLNQRDRAIENLMKDRLNKLRMSQELTIARNLQDTFINSFNNGIPSHLNASLHSIYKAADECAGDWYASHFDDAQNSLTIAIADVSGHGVSSAMFTAIIAALYDERIDDVGGNHNGLLNAIHLRLRHLAPDRMHVTFQILTWFPNEHLLRITNAGHPFPIYVALGEDPPKAKTIKIPSTPLGINESPVISSVTVTTSESFQLLMYTDGLTEGRSDADGSLFGNKRLREALIKDPKINGKNRIDYIYSGWKGHLGKRLASDDLCILLLESSKSKSDAKVA